MWIEGGGRGLSGGVLALLLAVSAGRVHAGEPAMATWPAWSAIAAQGAGVAPAGGVGAALARAVSRAAPPGVADGDVAVLEFARSAAVTRREQDAAALHFRRAGAAEAGEVEQRIRSGAMLREFDRLLANNGHSPTNLADVLAAYLVLSWEVVNDRDATRMPDGMRAVRRQLMAPLAALPSIAAMDDAAKQAQAERTAYLALAAVAAHRALKSGDDPAQLASLRANVRKSLLRSGVDLEALELTADGFRTR